MVKITSASLQKKVEKYPQKLFHNHYCLDGLDLGIFDWYFTLSEQYETHKQLKEGE